LKRSNRTRKKYYKYFDNSLYFVYRFGTRFKNKYSYKIKTSKKFRLFYGNLSKSYLKKKINSLKSSQTYKKFTKSQILLYKLEQRLDTILYRSHFATSIRTARQLISHGQTQNCLNGQKDALYGFIMSKMSVQRLLLHTGKHAMYPSQQWIQSLLSI
jgi:ribosomal protein S4